MQPQDADEPTVIGRRPIGPVGGGARRPSGAAHGPSVAFNPLASPPVPAAPSAPAPAAPLRPLAIGPGLPQAGPAGTAESAGALAAQILADPKEPADALIAAAAPLFIVVGQLRNTVENVDIQALRREMVDQLRRFEERAVRNQVSGGDVSAARYVMCALIDEAVMTTPWGSGSAWSDNSLLNQFHNETWGGEKVFTILDRVRQDPRKYLAVLKLIDLCLLMGFEGKFRVLDGGRERLEDLREEIGRLLRQYGSTPQADLSPNWRGIEAKRTVRHYVPLWVVFAAMGVIALIIYGYLRWRLSADLGPVEQLLRSLGRTGAS